MATPIDARSAIGRVSVAVAEDLAQRGHAVRMIGLDQDLPPPANRHATKLPLESWRTVDLAAVNRGDEVLIAHIGDHFPFHAGVYRLVEEAPTIGVFHDFYLYDLFWGRLVSEHGVSEAAGAVHDRAVQDLYGESIAASAQAARQGALAQARIAADLPMTEWFAGRCRAALAHSAFYAPRLATHCPGPVSVAALPWSGRDVSAVPERRDGRLSAVTVGVLNRNKCVEEVMRAIGASALLRENLRYDLVGPIEAAEMVRLEALAAELNLPDVHFHGAVGDAELVQHLDRADMICCLRNPVLEGASASAIEGLLSGRPVIVANAGFYADLPDDLVCKVDPDVPIDAVKQALESLVVDGERRRLMGAEARAWAGARFTMDQYNDVLLGLIADTQQASAVATMAQGVGAELRSLGISHADPVLDRLDVALRVFGGREGGGASLSAASARTSAAVAAADGALVRSNRRKAEVLADVNAELPPLDWHAGARRYLTHFFEKYSRGQIEDFVFTKPLGAITPEDPEGALGEAVFYLNNFANTIDLLKLPRDARVLDVACGGGWVSHWLRKLGYQTLGLDISAEFVTLAKERLARDPQLALTDEAIEAAFIEHDLEAAPLPHQERGRFDAAILESCLHHFFDPIAALSHVVDSLAPEGVVLILEGENREGPIKTAYMDVMLETHTLERPYSRAQFVEVARLAGLDHFVFLGAINGFFAETDAISQHMTAHLSAATRGANLCLGARSASALQRIVPSYRPRSPA